jgi:hypothetical protein
MLRSPIDTLGMRIAAITTTKISSSTTGSRRKPKQALNNGKGGTSAADRQHGHGRLINYVVILFFQQRFTIVGVLAPLTVI